MTEKKPGLIGRFFGGLWRSIDFARRALVNLIFLALVLFIFAMAFGWGEPELKGRTALVLRPLGEIVEQYSASPGDRALAKMFGDEIHETQLRDIVRVLQAAAKDPLIERLVIIPDEINGVGVSTLREVGAALSKFKESGKEVIALSNGMSQSQYYLAAHADQILLHPEGAVVLEGFDRYRTYYKTALDKLGVDVHLFRVGEFKSAGEPYIRDNASPEAREADLFWMTDLWNNYLAEIGALRKIEPSAIQAGIENFGSLLEAADGDLAKLALQQKLVDALQTRDEVRAMLIEKGAKDDEESTFRQIAFQDYLARVDRARLPDTRSAVAVVVAQGSIVGGEQPPGMIGGESTAKLLRDAREDDNVKALVLRVDSPGGEVFPSELIRREVELTKAAGKPVVVSMGDVAASGGYWISMNADEIYAQPTTITGSIGIFGLFLNIPNTLDKIGVHTDGVGTTTLAGAFDPRRPLDPKVGAMIQAVIDRGYQQFIGKVAAARGKTTAEIDAVARGRVWSGTQALERGLIDKLGGLDVAIAAAAERAQLGSDYATRYIEKELEPFERFLADMAGSAHARFAANLDFGSAVLLAQREVRDELRLFGQISGGKPAIYAYCFCNLE